MNEPLSYRGRAISAQDIESLRLIIAQNPKASRRKLSRLVCEAWNWRQANGALRDMVCRGLMLMLHRAGHIVLPDQKQWPHNPMVQRKKVPCDFMVVQTPVECRLQDLQPLMIRQVRKTGDEGLFNALIEQHHYLGYVRPVGEHLKYMIFSQGRPVACMLWGSAPWHIGPRDRLIGWNQKDRRTNLHLMACNTRFLILPWVKVPHLASHLLGALARRIAEDWQAVYGHPLYYLETFVDRELFKGTCYRAANWLYLGQTTGRGKKEKTKKVTRSLKDVLGLPLTKDFRTKMRAVPVETAPETAP